MHSETSANTDSLKSASEVADATARKALVYIIAPFCALIVLLGHALFILNMERTTTTRFNAIESQASQSIANGDLLQLRRLVSSLNSDRTFEDVKVILPSGEELVSWNEIDNPYGGLESTSNRRYPWPNSWGSLLTFSHTTPGSAGKARFVFEQRFPVHSYCLFLATVLLALTCIWILLQISLKRLARKLVAPVTRYAADLERARSGNDPYVSVQAIESSDYREFAMAVGKFKDLSQKIKSLEIEARENEKAKALSEIAAQVSHDIRSPLSALNIVVGNLDSIPDEKRQLIHDVSSRINKIANDLLARYRISSTPDANSGLVARTQSTEPEEERTPLRISNLLLRLVAEKRALIPCQSKVQIKTDIPSATDAFCLGNDSDLSRVLSNLLNNSLEAVEGEGKVTIALRTSANEIAIMVSDSGKGIPPEILEVLGHERCSQGKSGTTSGTGLGVFHAKRTVESYGGKLHIQSQVGVGTIVTVVLPRFKQGALSVC